MLSIFKKKELPRQMPSWERIVGMMYGKQLGNFRGRVLEVLYSRDHTMRVLLLRNKKGMYHYHFEKIEAYELDDWLYYKKMNPDALPAIWVFMDSEAETDFFATEQEAARELAKEPLFLQNFV